MADRPFSKALDRLRNAGLRPTRQRLALAKLLFENENRHVSAEQLHNEASREGIRVSLATVYNTLHQFTESGMMREVVVESGRSFFDTNTTDHHHFYMTKSGRLEDIPPGEIDITRAPSAPSGAAIERIDIVVRVDE